MELTPAAVEREYAWVRERADVVVPILNDVRQSLGEAFDADVPDVTREEYRAAVDAVFADGDRAVNAAALVAILRDLDVQDDYPGFVVDELLGRELAGIIAGEQPLRLLAESTFHYADVVTDADADRDGTASGDGAVNGDGSANGDGATNGDRTANGDDGSDDDGANDEGPEDAGVAGVDDLDAALAAGFQTRLPGWSWTEGDSPFSVTRDG